MRIAAIVMVALVLLYGCAYAAGWIWIANPCEGWKCGFDKPLKDRK